MEKRLYSKIIFIILCYFQNLYLCEKYKVDNNSFKFTNVFLRDNVKNTVLSVENKLIPELMLEFQAQDFPSLEMFVYGSGQKVFSLKIAPDDYDDYVYTISIPKNRDMVNNIVLKNENIFKEYEKIKEYVQSAINIYNNNVSSSQEAKSHIEYAIAYSGFLSVLILDQLLPNNQYLFAKKHLASFFKQKMDELKPRVDVSGCLQYFFSYGFLTRAHIDAIVSFLSIKKDASARDLEIKTKKCELKKIFESPVDAINERALFDVEKQIDNANELMIEDYFIVSKTILPDNPQMPLNFITIKTFRVWWRTTPRWSRA